MTNGHFLEHVSIINFKCFDSLEAENLKRVNLLGGDNNVGKSAFLEASKECIQAFTRIAEEYDHEHIKYLNFSRTVDNPDKIVATVLDSVGLEDHFQLGLDVR